MKFLLGILSAFILFFISQFLPSNLAHACDISVIDGPAEIGSTVHIEVVNFFNLPNTTIIMTVATPQSSYPLTTAPTGDGSGQIRLPVVLDAQYGAGDWLIRVGPASGTACNPNPLLLVVGSAPAPPPPPPPPPGTCDFLLNGKKADLQIAAHGTFTVTVRGEIAKPYAIGFTGTSYFHYIDSSVMTGTYSHTFDVDDSSIGLPTTSGVFEVIVRQGLWSDKNSCDPISLQVTVGTGATGNCGVDVAGKLEPGNSFQVRALSLGDNQIPLDVVLSNPQGLNTGFPVGSISWTGNSIDWEGTATIPPTWPDGRYAVQVDLNPGLTATSYLWCKNRSTADGLIEVKFVQLAAGRNPCESGICETAFGAISTSAGAFVTKVLQIALGLAAGIAIIFMVIGSIRMMTSSGDQQKLNGGREIFVAALAGLLFIVFSIIILRFIGLNVLRIPEFG